MWLVSFFSGLFMGIPFGVVFNIPKYGRTIVLVLGCVLGIYIMTNPTFMVGFAASVSGYDGLANIIGIILGQAAGKYMLESAIKELGS